MILAVLDPDGYFVTTETVDVLPDPMPIDRVVLPDGNDIEQRVAAGLRPRWDAQAKQWVFEQQPTPEQAVQQPVALRAIALGFGAIRDGKPLPQETLDWLAWYEKSVDAQG